jgi:hypothetical protein
VQWKKEEWNKHNPHNKQPNKKQTNKQKFFLLHNTRPFDDNANIDVGLKSFNYGAN